MSDPFIDALERGVRLFNRGEFLAAHEVWAARWRGDDGDGADLLRGLLHIALGLSQLQTGDGRAALKLLDQAVGLLFPYAPVAYQIDVDALIHALHQWRKGAEIALVGQGLEPPTIRPAIPLAS